MEKETCVFWVLEEHYRTLRPLGGPSLEEETSAKREPLEIQKIASCFLLEGGFSDFWVDLWERRSNVSIFVEMGKFGLSEMLRLVGVSSL